MAGTVFNLLSLFRPFPYDAITHIRFKGIISARRHP